MATYWYHNAYTGTIASYRQADELTDFPRGELLAYGDYLTTGLKSKEAAEAWAQAWHACLKCKAVRCGVVGELCMFCTEDRLVASQLEAVTLYGER